MDWFEEGTIQIVMALVYDIGKEGEENNPHSEVQLAFVNLE